jgi:drug/metabolite transporter (DMT)-like permease
MTAASPSGLGWPVLVALVAGSLCAAGGTFLLKLGANGATALFDYFNMRVFAGFALYGIGSAAWIFAMSRAPLSVVYPFNALTFILVMAAGMAVLGERPGPAVIAGSLMILGGIGCIAIGSLA